MVHAEPSFVLNSDLKNNNCEHFLWAHQDQDNREVGGYNNEEVS